MTCARGRRYSYDAWLKLPRLGFQQKGLDVAGALLELRNCVCRSTLAFDVSETPTQPDLKVR